MVEEPEPRSQQAIEGETDPPTRRKPLTPEMLPKHPPELPETISEENDE